ncbi:MAG: F0F1 ATP synthase subunit epsilon [Gammaproteobacteria bacterium]|nr:F0F1 ATP synthase subunit epsilon [Gammaproteobacteria bacterium]
MNSFTLSIQDATHTETFDGVSSFVGEDASGSFGILPSHARMMTSLVMGLSRFRIAQQEWQYIATPGALIYFHDNTLNLLSRHFLIDQDYMRISAALGERLLEEEAQLHNQKQSLRRMEEEVLKRLWELGRREA